MNTEKLKIQLTITALTFKARLFGKLSWYIDNYADWYRKRTARIAAKAKQDAYHLKLKQLPLPSEWEPLEKDEVEVLVPYYQVEDGLDTGKVNPEFFVHGTKVVKEEKVETGTSK